MKKIFARVGLAAGLLAATSAHADKYDEALYRCRGVSDDLQVQQADFPNQPQLLIMQYRWHEEHAAIVFDTQTFDAETVIKDYNSPNSTYTFVQGGDFSRHEYVASVTDTGPASAKAVLVETTKWHRQIPGHYYPDKTETYQFNCSRVQSPLGIAPMTPGLKRSQERWSKTFPLENEKN